MMDAATLSTLIEGQSSQNIAAIAARSSAHRQVQKMTLEQTEQAAKDFEALFLTQMLEQMFGDSIGDDMFGDEETKEVYKGLLMEQYGKKIAEAGGIGIADYVKRELLRLQEAL